MGILISLILNICPPTEILPKGIILTERGHRDMEAARKACKKFYGPNSCLVKFILEKELTYSAVCEDINDIN